MSARGIIGGYYKVGRLTDRHCGSFGAVCFGFVLVSRP